MPSQKPLTVIMKDFSKSSQILVYKDPFYDDDLDDSNDSELLNDHFQKRKTQVPCQKQTLACYISIGICISTIIGIVIGRSTIMLSANIIPPSSSWKYTVKLRDAVINEIKSENIKDNLKVLTTKPHLAGSVQDEVHLVNFIKEKWSSYLDDVRVYPYDVLLSFPNATDKNFAGILHKNGSITHKSSSDEQPVTEFEKNAKNVASAFNAYSPPGHVEGNLYFVNYGREEDFMLLSDHNINLTGSICIAKYGMIFRGDKAKFAHIFNCSALMLYTDPYDYAGASVHDWNPDSIEKGYPNSWWMPSTGFQRGTLLEENGDPLTPDYPAHNFTYRISEKEANLPKIPVVPISYKDAFQFLSILDGSVAPYEWQGGLNINYTLGGSFIKPYSDCKVIVHVGDYFESKTIHTVVGFIRGWLEPDRYVLFGNHRDAWTFGGADPSGGTAILLEVSRAVAKVVHDGIWRPRRTIVFCSWGSEEYGLVGSVEWVEEMEKLLLVNAVAYINIDIPVHGNDFFYSQSCPSLKQLLYNVTQSVHNPISNEVNHGRKSVYDTWLHYIPDSSNPSVPFVPFIGSGSDFTYFIQKAGVASVDLRYTFDSSKIRASSYPVYHSIHDTFEYVEKFLDPNFNISLAIASITADAILQLSGSIILPINPVDTAVSLNIMSGILQNNFGDVFDGTKVSLNELNRTISKFNTNAHNLMLQVTKVNTSDDLLVRRLNNKLFYINRGFLDFNGIPGRSYYRNVVFAPSSQNSYSGEGFPAVTDAAFEARKGGSVENVKKELSVLCTEILSAASLMQDL